MEIKIDTSKDSRQDIRKAIKLLQSIIEEGPESDSYNSTQFPSGENVLGGFFDAEDTPLPADSDTSGSRTIQDTEDDEKGKKPRKFSVGSAGGFDVY